MTRSIKHWSLGLTLLAALAAGAAQADVYWLTHAGGGTNTLWHRLRTAGQVIPARVHAPWMPLREKLAETGFDGGMDQLASALADYRIGTVGKPLPETECRISEQGEILSRSPSVCSGYYKMDDKAEELLEGGWLHSGDTGTLDEDGYVYIVDRVKDMVNVAGFKVYPAEVEQVLYRHPAVKELAVYGIPHASKGEVVKAAVVLADGQIADQEEIKAFCRENMAAYKVPAEVAFIDELPKSATGKILKRVLREQESSA